MNLSIDDFLEGEVGFDVCGMAPVSVAWNSRIKRRVPISNLKKFVVSHEHDDQLPAQADSKLIAPNPIIESVEERYARFERRMGMDLDVEIVGHSNYEPTEHYSITEDGRKKPFRSYVLKWKKALALIPESAYQQTLLKRYEHFKHGIVYRVPRIDSIEKPVRPRELPSGWHYADNTKIGRSRVGVMPKCVPSLEDEIVLRKGQIIHPKASKASYMYPHM